MISKKEATEIALDIIEGGEFGNFWQEVNREDFKVLVCDWVELDQEWIVKVRGWCLSDGGAWLMSLALGAAGELIGGIFDVED